MNAPHHHDLGPFTHSHRFGDAGADARSQALRAVTWITLATMAVELAAGWWSGSLALLADGWHMGTHAAALGGAALAAGLAKRAHGDAAYAFGGWKIEVLAAYTSGLLLLAVSVMIVIDGVAALRDPQPIRFAEALIVAVIGLAVNLACAWLLARGAKGDGRAHDAGHAHDDGHAHHRHDTHNYAHAHDHNFNAAYIHVLADAVTSVLAIAALAGGLWFGWNWLDAAVALLGAVIIGRWACSVLGGSARALVDATADAGLREAVRTAVESDGDAKLADLHVWQIGPGAFAAALSVVADAPLPAQNYQARLESLEALRHVTVEVHRCRG